MNRVSVTILLSLSLLAIAFSGRTSAQDTPPNIVFILVDDIGIISTPPYGQGSVWDPFTKAPVP